MKIDVASRVADELFGVLADLLGDRLVLLAFVALLAVFTALGFAGITSELYVFPFLLDLAGA